MIWTAIGLALLGLLAGGAAAALGVGGGIVFVPALVIVFSFDQQLAQGTSLAVILPTALVAAIVHHRGRRVVWPVAAWVSTGAVAGALAGSRIALALDPNLLRRLFATLLLVLAAWMTRRAGRAAG